MTPNPSWAFPDFHCLTAALDGATRAAVFDALPTQRQEQCWAALADEWADHRRRDWRGVLEDQGVVT